MSKIHIFVDESGSFAQHDHNGRIVFVAVVTERPDDLRRVVRRTRRAKLRTKQERRMSEIKGSTATDKFKDYLYRVSMRTPYTIVALYLDMKNMSPTHWKRRTGVVRLRLIKKLLELAGASTHDFVAHDIALQYRQGIDRWYRLLGSKIVAEHDGADYI